MLYKLFVTNGYTWHKKCSIYKHIGRKPDGDGAGYRKPKGSPRGGNRRPGRVKTEANQGGSKDKGFLNKQQPPLVWVSGYGFRSEDGHQAETHYMKRRTHMSFKIDERKVFSNDKLVKFDDGSFKYFDTYGDYVEFSGSDSLYSWLSEEGIAVDNEFEAWIDGE
jgi:hypothetical protein